MVEHLICTEEVTGSSPVRSTTNGRALRYKSERSEVRIPIGPLLMEVGSERWEVGKKWKLEVGKNWKWEVGSERLEMRKKI